MEFSPGDKVWVKRSNGLWWPALVEEQALTPNGKNRKRKREGGVTVKYPFEEGSETVPDSRRIKAFDCAECHQLIAGPDNERSSRRRSSTYDASLFQRAVGALLTTASNKLTDNDPTSTANTVAEKSSNNETGSGDTASPSKNSQSTTDTSNATKSTAKSFWKPAAPKVSKPATPKVSKTSTPKVSKPSTPKVSKPVVKATPPNQRRSSRSKPSTPATPQEHCTPVTDQENQKPGENPEKLKSVILDEPRVPTIGLMLPLFEADLPDITPSKRSRAGKPKDLKRRVRPKITVTTTPLMRRESFDECEKVETVAAKRRSRSRSSSAGRSLRSTNSTDGDEESMAQTSNDESRKLKSRSPYRRSFPLSDGACDLKSVSEEKVDEPVVKEDEKQDEADTTKNEEPEVAGKSGVNAESDEPRTPGACGESFLCPSPEVEEAESDDDDDLPVFSSQSPSKFQGTCFQRGDIVWAKCLKFPPWPAVVRTVYKKRGRLDKVSVFFIGDPCTRGQNGFRFKYHPNKMKYFCTDEGHTLERRDDPVVMAVVNRVDDYLTKKALGKTQLNPFEHFKMSDVEEAPIRDDNDDDVNVTCDDVTRARPDDVIESVTSSDTDDEDAEENNPAMPDKVEKELSRCAARTQKLVDFILSEDCTSYARDVIRGRKGSQLHREFDPENTTNLGNFGPIEDDDQLFEVYGHLMRIVEEDGSIPPPHRHAYVSAVLAPECIVLAMRRVIKYSGPRAWAQFTKGPQHSRALLQYEHDSILASAERIPEKERIRHREMMEGRCRRLMDKFNINMDAI